MFMSHTSLHFIVLSFVLACACVYVASEDQVFASFCFKISYFELILHTYSVNVQSVNVISTLYANKVNCL